MCLAVPGRIVSTHGCDGLGRIGRVDFSGVIRDIDLSFVPEADIGQHVLVHAGFAISVIDDDEAQATLACLAQIGELEETP
jgi:hydrogenase expression/formation protein HypC